MREERLKPMPVILFIPIFIVLFLVAVVVFIIWAAKNGGFSTKRDSKITLREGETPILATEIVWFRKSMYMNKIPRGVLDITDQRVSTPGSLVRSTSSLWRRTRSKVSIMMAANAGDHPCQGRQRIFVQYLSCQGYTGCPGTAGCTGGTVKQSAVPGQKLSLEYLQLFSDPI